MTEDQQHSNKLTEHLFRHSYGKTVAILVKYFGLEHVEIAEDMVQDTLVDAMEQWSIKGVPTNPQGWIMDVAKKKTINFLKRNQIYLAKVVPALQNSSTPSEGEISDSTLRMIFACCNPSLPMESQIALALKTLCGLSIPEIARALLTTEENINKRLYRAKTKFRNGSIVFSIPGQDHFEERLDGVTKTLYLLFNEGYYAPQHAEVLRTDLCYEAVRLTEEVETYFEHCTKVKGLLALMYFTLARFESRLDEKDTLICLQDQNRDLWDKELIARGMHYLHQSTGNHTPNTYQLLAGIAAEHCLAADFVSTNWPAIYHQYQLLETLDNRYLVRMNRLIAYYFSGHQQAAIHKLLQFTEEKDFQASFSYYLTLGVLFRFSEDKTMASEYLHKAMAHARSSKEKQLVQRRLEALDSI